MRIYVASSWRNTRQPVVVEALREAGHNVYDFRHPEPDNDGFSWREIAPDWQSWSPEQFREALDHPIAQRGFDLDFGAMERADAGVLVMPCGRSAHLEAGYFVGARKPLRILLSPAEPELMYKMATGLHLDTAELVASLAVDAVTIRVTEAEAAVRSLAAKPPVALERLVEIAGAESVDALETHVRELVRELERRGRRITTLEARARKIIDLAGGRQ